MLNDTEEKEDHIYLERRQDPWILGVQSSLYPSSLATVENIGTGSLEETGVLVEPSGPMNGHGGGSGLPTSVKATTTGGRVMSSAASAAAATGVSYAMITSEPLCSPL